MNIAALVGIYTLVIFLEALVDGLVYKSWTKHKVVYGILNHITQIFLLVGFFFWGHWYAYDIWSIESLWVLITYTMFRIGFFNFFYGFITGDEDLGKTDIFDIILSKLKLSFFSSYIFRLFIVFIAIVIMIVKL